MVHEAADPYLWLEDVEGDDALGWVGSMNAAAEGALCSEPLFEELRNDVLGVLEADDRIPMPSKHEETVLNFWTDGAHRRGVLRRTTWDRYVAADPDWETVLDIDALAETEGESWVLHGLQTRHPDRRRMLVDLSPGGSDASVTREFDLVEKRFIPSGEGGFTRPLSKGWLAWIDDDTVYVGADSGPGSLTKSGYPRTVRRWGRGTPLADAPVVFEGEEDDVSVRASVETLPGYRHHLFQRGVDFYHSRTWILRDGEPVEIRVPDDAEVSVRERWLLVSLRSDWTVEGSTYVAGSLLVTEIDAFLDGAGSLRTIFEPTPTTALTAVTWTRNHLVLTVKDDVRDRLEVHSPVEEWSRRAFPGTPPVWTLTVAAVDADANDLCLLFGNDFLHESTLLFGSTDAAPEVLRRGTPRFDTEGMTLTQQFATSADGTRIPYFVVDAGDAPGPTVLSAYGGFEISNPPTYSGIIGRAWLARGGTYVLANIRGGGEYGPRWHQAGLRENRHRVYEDFEAVARDLIATGVTTPAQLGIIGGSNGGLLVANMYTRCPDLFGAVVCQAPLLDMKRYSHLLAGASWIAEYGDPDDPDDWQFIKTFSPYHLIQPDVRYPPMLLTTSTRDDRVHPGHARKMAAALSAQGHDVNYWENTEGGHGGAADALQQAKLTALAYTFLHRHLGGHGS